MKEYRTVFLIPLFIVLSLALCWYRQQITITSIQDTNSIVLPPNIKQRLLNDNRCEFMYVSFDGQHLQYYYISQNLHRRDIVLGALKQLHASLIHTLPKGNFLFFLHDGSHSDEGVPILALSGVDKLIADKHIVLIPDSDSLLFTKYSKIFKTVDHNLRRHPWESKQAKIFWRGGATGIGPENNDLYASPRLRFMHYTKNLDFVDAGITTTFQLNDAFMKKLNEIFPKKKQVDIADSLAYKYLIDMDGNSCSFSRMAWILYSNSLLLKHSSNKKQWYYDQLQPYVHYLPIAADFSNLEQQFEWAEAHPKEAKTIALNGRKLARRVFNKNGILSALQDAMLEYKVVYAEYISSLNNTAL